MALAHINRFRKKKLHIEISIPSNNKQLHNYCMENNIEFQTHDINHSKLEILHTFLDIPKLIKTKKFINTLIYKYDKIVIIQGDIEIGSNFLKMSNRQGINVISYLPYAHSFKSMGSKLGYLKDKLSKLVYRYCENYITISECFKNDIFLLQPKAKIKVLKNFVDSVPISEIRGVGYRLEKKQNSFNILMPGRISFRQKGQDILVKALCKIKHDNVNVFFVGSGPDEKKLKELVKQLPKKINSIFVGWKSNLWEDANDKDIVVIPSQYEGVPLVMLEALKRNIPVIAARRDGMKDYLSSDYTYIGKNNDKESESQALAEKIDEFIAVYYSQNKEER